MPKNLGTNVSGSRFSMAAMKEKKANYLQYLPEGDDYVGKLTKVEGQLSSKGNPQVVASYKIVSGVPEGKFFNGEVRQYITLAEGYAEVAFYDNMTTLGVSEDFDPDTDDPEAIAKAFAAEALRNSRDEEFALTLKVAEDGFGKVDENGDPRKYNQVVKIAPTY